MGIEPTSVAWKATALPLSYARRLRYGLGPVVEPVSKQSDTRCNNAVHDPMRPAYRETQPQGGGYYAPPCDGQQRTAANRGSGRIPGGALTQASRRCCVARAQSDPGQIGQSMISWIRRYEPTLAPMLKASPATTPIGLGPPPGPAHPGSGRQTASNIKPPASSPRSRLMKGLSSTLWAQVPTMAPGVQAAARWFGRRADVSTCPRPRSD